jgi:hypothetical protein
MKISIACPAALHANPAVLEPMNGAAATVTVEGGLLGFEFSGEDPLSLIREWDAGLGLAIADSDDAAEITALSQLKAAVGEVERHVRRESSYISRASESTEATDADAVSHLQGEQHTSTDDSSEQHGVATDTDEENEIESQEEQEQPRSRKQR